MALPATEAFTGADGTQLTAIATGGNWTLNDGDLQVYSNAIMNDDAGTGAAHWNADSFDDDQYAKITHTAENAAQYIGVGVRMHASAETFYGVWWNNALVEVIKYVSGTYSQLYYDASGGPDIGAVVKLTANGTSIDLYYDDEDQTIAVTDSDIASGSAGVIGFGGGALTRADDWEGGNLSVAVNTSIVVPTGPWR